MTIKLSTISAMLNYSVHWQSCLLFLGMSKIIHFGRGLNQATTYGKRMDRLSRRIFGELVRPTDQKSMKVVRLFSDQPYEQIDKWNPSYYPNTPMFHYLTKLLRMQGLFRDEHLDFSDEMARQRLKRGKVINPPIGQGKRAQLRKGAK